ncbi:MAG: NlpC/P60 family protein [Alicyclobacillaceae bacterium]|nr:NlpC/P60 family protein [Alicyclobacillaceae bacterium]
MKYPKAVVSAVLIGTSLFAGTPAVWAHDYEGTGPGGGHVIVHPDRYPDPRVQKVIEVAESQIGTPYKWGTNKLRGDDTFDCSNFTQYVYETALGYHFSSGSKNQGDLNQYKDWGVYYDIREIKAGDLLFFSTSSSGGKVGHVGIALEDGTLKIIHTYSPRVPLGEYDYTHSGWWRSHFLYARRPLNHLAANGQAAGPVRTPETAARPDASGQGVTPVRGTVNVRSEPSLGAPVVGVLRLGEEAALLGRVNDWWYRVRLADGTVGYITTSSRYVRVT